ncbi:hypothetical protein GCU60_03550 [Blastococcus saxobsidens]|uniref:Uncharacterized protein n=1 Tax=Blastococcus saxobsidens TaxID=138336 RepID=A0A6L9VYI6_9ACTN|nr:hypothetical protein [Blastococcus saxobsidens]NEK84843.1 hypothetical protein [Blastococcus saxobsidens]
MSTPSDPQSPDTPAGAAAPSSTQEIPVVTPAATGATSVQQLPPPSSPAPSPAPAAMPASPPTPPAPAPEVPSHHETGPVGFVPGLPGAGTPPPPPPGASWPQTLEEPTETPAAERPPRDKAALMAGGLVLLSLVLLQLGLSLEFGTVSAWSAIPLWSAFATVCVLLGLAAVAELIPGGRRLGGSGWSIAAGGLVGLAVFWVLVVLPGADSDRGFLLTAAVGALGAALWLRAGRRSA